MSHGLLRDARLYVALVEFDRDLAEKAHLEGCECGGALHAAHYPRKPRGGPGELPPGYGRRLSFCCAREGCRRRTTPPSIRFLGRRVFLGAVVLLGSAMRHGLSAKRVRELGRMLGVSRRTLERWRRWWLEIFATTAVWRARRGSFIPPVELDRLPASLLERFSGDPRERLMAALRLVMPLSVSNPEQAT